MPREPHDVPDNCLAQPNWLEQVIDVHTFLIFARMAKSKSSSSLVSVLYAIAFVREACVLLMSVIFIRSAGEYKLKL